MLYFVQDIFFPILCLFPSIPIWIYRIIPFIRKFPFIIPKSSIDFLLSFFSFILNKQQSFTNSSFTEIIISIVILYFDLKEIQIIYYPALFLRDHQVSVDSIFIPNLRYFP